MSKRSLNLDRPVSNHPSNQGLVGWWLTLPGMIGGPRHRDIFAGNHAVLQAYSPPTGPNIVADGTSSRFGAMVLDGDDKHGAEAQIVGAATLNLSGPLTISWWMQNRTSGAYGFSACVCDSGINGIGLDYSQVQQNSSGSTLTSSPVRLAPNKYYLLYTQDATTNYLYVNGVLYSSTTNARNNVNLSRVWFGKNTYLSGSQSPPAGDLVGDLRLRRTYTTAAEAALWYQQRLKGYPDFLAYRSWVSFAKKAGGTAYTLAVDQGSVSLSGQAVNLLAARTLPVAQGSVTLTAEPANLLAGRVQVVDQGTVNLSAQSVNLLAGRSLPVAQDSVALTGQSVNLLAARTLPVAQGSVTLSGQAVNLLAARTLPVAQGSVALSAQDVNLIYSGGGAKVLTVDQGTISLSGQSVNLLAARTLPVAQGSVTLTAEPVNLLFGRTLTVSQGTIALTAEPVNLLAVRTLPVVQASVALTAQAVTLTYSGSGAKVLTVDQGTISLSGQAVNLVYSGGAKVLAVDQDTITLSAQSANLLASRKIAVDQGAITLTAYNVNLTYSGAPVSRAVIAIRCLNGNRWVRAARTPGG